MDSQSHLPANLSYLVPPGYVDTSDKFQPVVDLMSPASGRALEDIRFLVNDPATNVSGRPQIDIAGLPAYVVAEAARTGTYATYVKQVVITCGAGVQFIVICNGSQGYDLAVMSSGCDAFLKSLAFPVAAVPSGSPCPPIPAVQGYTTTIACSLPPGYRVVAESPPAGIMLAAPLQGPMRERIILNYNPPTISWQLAGHTRITIDGCPAYVLDDSSTSTEYLKQVVLLCGAHSPFDNQFSVQCRGYAGYDPSLAANGCAGFLGSLHIVGVPLPTPAPGRVPAGTVPFSPVGMPIGVAVIMGIWVWGIIRLEAWLWPYLAGFRRALWDFLRGTALGCLLLFVFVVATALNIATHLFVVRDLVLVFWPIIAVALVLEVAWRLVRRPLGFGRGRSGMVPPPPPPPPPAPPPLSR